MPSTSALPPSIEFGGGFERRAKPLSLFAAGVCRPPFLQDRRKSFRLLSKRGPQRLMPNWARHGRRKEKRKYFALPKTRHILSVDFTRKEVSKKADQKLTKKNRASFRYQVKRIARERLFLSTRPDFRLDSSCLWPLFERKCGLPPNAGGIPQKHYIGRSNHPLRPSCDAWFEIHHDEPKDLSISCAIVYCHGCVLMMCLLSITCVRIGKKPYVNEHVRLALGLSIFLLIRRSSILLNTCELR